MRNTPAASGWLPSNAQNWLCFHARSQLDPNLALAYYDRGGSHAQKGDHDKAIPDYTEAITLDPTQPIFYSCRANAYRALGEDAKAASDKKKAEELRK